MVSYPRIVPASVRHLHNSRRESLSTDTSFEIGPSIPLGYLHQAGIRIVWIRDETKSVLTADSHALEEWWIVPNNVFTWGQSNLEAAGSTNLNELIKRFLSDENYRLMYAQIRNTIYRNHDREVKIGDFYLNFSSRLVEDVGQVISIICGDKKVVENFLGSRRPANT
jgi:hypothetical protein